MKYSKVTLSRITSHRRDRKRAGSVDRVGLATGIDLLLNEYVTANIEGRFFDEKGLNARLSWKF